MTNSIFINILKVIRVSKITDVVYMTSLINEYIDWCKLSQDKYSKHYERYINSLNEILILICNKEPIEEIYGYIADLISMYYIISDENEV